MSISHRDTAAPETDEPMVFAQLGGVTCSICAPNTMTKLEVEDYAGEKFPGERWKSINKADLGFGGPTPNPCNDAPDRRLHWFLWRESIARELCPSTT